MELSRSWCVSAVWTKLMPGCKTPTSECMCNSAQIEEGWWWNCLLQWNWTRSLLFTRFGQSSPLAKWWYEENSHVHVQFLVRCTSLLLPSDWIIFCLISLPSYIINWLVLAGIIKHGTNAFSVIPFVAHILFIGNPCDLFAKFFCVFPHAWLVPFLILPIVARFDSLYFFLDLCI
jgi:hypothetical protein